MFVRQGIINCLALPAEFDQLAALQHPELVGHGALGDLHELGDITDAQLSLQQGVQDLDSGAVPNILNSSAKSYSSSSGGSRARTWSPASTWTRSSWQQGITSRSILSSPLNI